MAELNNHAGRAHALLSASSASRWLVCPPSAVAAELYPKKSTEYTREGTLAHEVAELAARSRLVSMDVSDLFAGKSNIPAEMVDCASGYADYIQEQIRGEDRMLFLEQRVDFSSWVPDGFGTADCIVIQDKTLDVIDYKYGKGVAVSAEENPQMKLYGLGALNEYGFACDVETVRLHIYQPRINNVSVFTLSAADLLKWGEEIKPIAVQAAKGEGEMKSGAHCRFCPHAGACPELARASTRTVESFGGKVAVPTLAPWQVADILKSEPIISAWLKAVKERAMACLMNGETIPGYKLVAGKSTRSWADELEVGKILEGAGYTREDYTTTELLSPAAMEKALGKKRVADLLSGQVLTNSGGPAVAPESDKRKPFDRLAEARKDFE